MNKLIHLVLLSAGVALIVYGIQATESIGSDISRLFNGAPTNKAIWLLLGGLLVAAVGATGLLHRAKTP